MTPLPKKYQDAIWLTLFKNPTQLVIDWLKKTSGAKAFLKKKVMTKIFGQAI